jgi:hypothetical protein
MAPWLGQEAIFVLGASETPSCRAGRLGSMLAIEAKPGWLACVARPGNDRWGNSEYLR